MTATTAATASRMSSRTVVQETIMPGSFIYSAIHLIKLNIQNLWGRLSSGKREIKVKEMGAGEKRQLYKTYMKRLSCLPERRFRFAGLGDEVHGFVLDVP